MANRSITFPTTDLFTVAAHAYGDATQWNVIAAANPAACLDSTGRPNPFITGPVTLVIPPAAPGGGKGGLLVQ